MILLELCGLDTSYLRQLFLCSFCKHRIRF